MADDGRRNDATPREMWAILHELPARQRETDRRMLETDRRMQDTVRRIRKLGELFVVRGGS